MNEFSEIRSELERKFEDLLIDITNLTTPKGFRLGTNEMPILEEFNKLIDSAERCYLNSETRLAPGDKNNED